MQPRYKERKATQAACLLLDRASGEMNYMVLIKLLYLADREALLRWGRPITFDRYVSMDQGPVLSRTLDLINEGVPPDWDSYWTEHIEKTGSFEVRISEQCGDGELSEAEIEVLDEIFEEFGTIGLRDKWELVELLHEILDEWQDPEGSALPIKVEDILRAEGKTPQETEAVKDELEGVALAEQTFA